MEVKTKKMANIEQRALSRVRPEERQSWVSIAFMWIGVMISIPMLMVGGMFADQLTMGNIVIASVLGFGICGAIMVLMGIMGTDLGVPAAMSSSKAFGYRGSSYLMSVVLIIGCLGWFAVQTSACGTAFIILLSYFGIPNFPYWLSCLIWGAVMLFTAVTGFKFMKILNYIAVPALIIICAYGTVDAIGNVGWANIVSNVPSQPISLALAISTCIGLFANATIINSDYSRYAKSRKDTLKASLIGVVPAALFMIGMGAIMALAANDADITNVFANMGQPVLGMLVLILATWTTNTGNAYGAGLAAMKLGNFKDKLRPIITLGCGALALILAITNLADLLVNFISLISSITPAIAGVMIADYWVIGKGKPENWHIAKGVNWLGIIAWAMGATVGFFFSFFSPALDSILVSFVAYIALYAAFGKTKMVGQGIIDIDELEKEKAAGAA